MTCGGTPPKSVRKAMAENSKQTAPYERSLPYPQYFVTNDKHVVDTYDMINDLIIRLKELRFKEEFFIKGQYDDIKYEIKVERV